MRKLKQTLVMLLAAVMLLGTMTTAMAADAMQDTGTVTIENAVAGVTYKLYRVFDISGITADGTKSSFITNIKWNTAIRNLNLGFGTIAGEANEVGAAVTPNESFTEAAKAQAFAAAVVTAANGSPVIAADAEQTVTTSGIVTISGLRYGFYVMVSSRDVGENETQYTVFTLNKATFTIREKNTNTPAIKKLVKVEGDTDYVEAVSADFNATLNYQITVIAAAGTDKYVITDTLPTPIDYVPDTLQIQKVSDTTTTNLVSNKDYTVNAEGKVVTIEVSADVRASLKDGDKLVITYNGKLIPNETTLTGYLNNAELTCDGKRIDADDAVVYTGHISFHKRDSKSNAHLAGAKFVITKVVDGTTYYAILTKVENSEQAYDFASWTGTSGEATVITTTGDGTTAHTIRGLAAGTYTLVETEAPANYIKGADTSIDITATVDASGIITKLETNTVTVLNTPGSELPSTGGIGTTIFYIAGALLVVSAVALLVIKRRKHA